MPWIVATIIEENYNIQKKILSTKKSYSGEKNNGVTWKTIWLK